MKRSAYKIIWCLLLLSFSGCDSNELQPIKGKVEFSDGTDFLFTGDIVELRLQSQNDYLAFAAIKPDGTFQVESMVDGVIGNGASPGNYDARIVISDDEPSHKQEAEKAIDPRFLEFATSGLQVQVPSPSELKLSLTKPSLQPTE